MKGIFNNYSMTVLTTLEFTDYNELDDLSILETIKQLCEFDGVTEPYLIEIASKSHFKKTIKYKIKIYDLSTAT